MERHRVLFPPARKPISTVPQNTRINNSVKDIRHVKIFEVEKQNKKLRYPLVECK